MWQTWHQQHKENVSIVAIAEDSQPAEKIIPWTTGVTFPVLHDHENMLYEKYAPNVTSTLVIDEQGKLTRPWRYASIMEETFKAEITEWVISGKAPLTWLDLDATRLPSLTGDEEEAYARARLAAILVKRGQIEAALKELRHAHELFPQNYVIKNQLGVLERPKDYYEGDMSALNF